MVVSEEFVMLIREQLQKQKDIVNNLQDSNLNIVVSDELTSLVRAHLQKHNDIVYRLKSGDLFEKPEFLEECDNLTRKILKENRRNKFIEKNFSQLKKLCPSNNGSNQIKSFMFIYNSYTGEIIGNDIEKIPDNSESREYSILFPIVHLDGTVTKNDDYVGFIKLNGEEFHAKLDKLLEEIKPHHNLFDYVFNKLIHFRNFGKEIGDYFIADVVNKYNEEIQAE